MTPKKPFISLTSDFGVQSQGAGIMEAVAWEICPAAKIVHLMHGLPDFDLIVGARTMETVSCLPVGCHVCVVDPGVGTARKGVIIQVQRGDFLIGPDNGVLIPATRVLGGIARAVELQNEKYMREPVSPIFHGRDVFAPAAAYLTCGVALDEFGASLEAEELAAGPYEEAMREEALLRAQVISVNKFGSLHLNILQAMWDEFGATEGSRVSLEIGGQEIGVPFVTTFGNVGAGEPLIMKDDYGRVEVAINKGSFASLYSARVGDRVVIRRLAA